MDTERYPSQVNGISQINGYFNMDFKPSDSKLNTNILYIYIYILVLFICTTWSRSDKVLFCRRNVRCVRMTLAEVAAYGKLEGMSDTETWDRRLVLSQGSILLEASVVYFRSVSSAWVNR